MPKSQSPELPVTLSTSAHAPARDPSGPEVAGSAERETYLAGSPPRWAAPTDPAGPLIDWHRVAELRDEIGLEDFDEVVALFLTEVQATLDRLPARAENLQDLSEELHFLKGSTLNLGFRRLSMLCEAGELAISAGLGAPLDPDLLRRCYARSREEFLERLPALRAA